MSKQGAYQRVPVAGDSEEEEEVTLFDKRFGEGVYEENVELIFRQRKGGKLQRGFQEQYQQQIFNKRSITCGAVVLLALLVAVLIGYTAWRIQANKVLIGNTTASTPGPSAPTPSGNDELTLITGTNENDPNSWRVVMEGGMTELSMILHDINKDGTPDIIINNVTDSYDSAGYDGCQDQPDKCLETKGFSPCQVRLLAFDGRSSAILWNEWALFESFASNCRTDLNKDGQSDCIFAGRGGSLAAFDLFHKELLWVVDPAITVPPYNYYYPLITKDFDKDGVPDIIVTHGGDPFYSDTEKKRTPGFLAVISGATGQGLSRRIIIPDNHETYSSPVLYRSSDNIELVLFGSGGETIPGSLWALTLSSLEDHVASYKKETSYTVNKVYKNFVCYTKEQLTKLRPKLIRGIYSTSKHEEWMKACPVLAGGVSPIWNVFGLCVYELIPAGVSGTILPPVIADVNNDNHLDLLVSQFNDHTLLYDGASGLITWDHYSPDTQTYSIPGPLYYNDDDTLDFVARFNKGRWMNYEYSYMTVLDGRNGDILWRINCSQAAMSSPVTVHSKTRGDDGFLFLGIGCGKMIDDIINSGERSSHSPNDGRSKRSAQCPVKHFERDNDRCVFNPLDVLLHSRQERHGNDDGLLQGSGDNDVRIPPQENMIDIDFSEYYPDDLWESNGPMDIFPDPDESPESFMKDYCGYDPDLLQANIYFLNRKLIESLTDVIPVMSFDTYIYKVSHKDLKKHHGENKGPTASDTGEQSMEDIELMMIKKLMKDRKGLRCAHVMAPVLSAGTPVITDSDGDVPSPYSVKVLDFIHPPKLIVQSLTIENRLKAIYGTQVQGVSSDYWPMDKQPWTEYMGSNGNGVYVKHHK
uniref:FAM234A/B beta-propeller domain-containing protein n=1 Tax=Amphimedon queenslandica TaxID=400682 RepID=A0A1X7TXJ2_AMPQE